MEEERQHLEISYDPQKLATAICMIYHDCIEEAELDEKKASQLIKLAAR